MGNQVAEYLKEWGAVKTGNAFKLRGGGISNIYVDCRSALDRGERLRAMARQMEMALSKYRPRIRFHVVHGTGLGGIPLAVTLATAASTRSCYPFSWTRDSMYKEHGVSRVIEGAAPTGKKVLIVDDVLTTGTSVAEEARKIKAGGGTVAGALVIVDRAGEKEGTLSGHLGFPVLALCRIADLS